MATPTLTVTTPRSRERLVGPDPTGPDGRPCAASTARPFPPDRRVPSMLTEPELNYLHWLTADVYRGTGGVVELGCYLGGSTAALADGLARNPRAHAPLLTYDAFVMDEWSNSFLATPFRRGESFRPLFDIYNRDRLHAITVREGWIPEDAPAIAGPDLYPEQTPIEILFVDAAKTWPVHNTVLRCFGPHLVADESILVQQDFKDALVYWLPLHMHRLRECFEPLDNLPRSCTVSFRYRGGLTGRLDALGAPGKMDADDIDAEWDDIERFWAAYPCPELTPRLHLHRVSHLFSVCHFDRVQEELERFAREFDTRACGAEALQVAHAWRGLLDVMQWQLARLPGGETLAAALERLQARELPGAARRFAWSRPGRATPWSTELLCERLWRSVAARCAAEGWRRVALYGGGQHTRKLLASGWPDGMLDVVAILDDEPGAATLDGRPVCRPEDAPPALDAVVLSSDVYESAMAERAEGWLTPIPVVRVYTD